MGGQGRDKTNLLNEIGIYKDSAQLRRSIDTLYVKDTASSPVEDMSTLQS